MKKILNLALLSFSLVANNNLEVSTTDTKPTYTYEGIISQELYDFLLNLKKNTLTFSIEYAYSKLELLKQTNPSAINKKFNEQEYIHKKAGKVFSKIILGNSKKEDLISVHNTIMQSIAAAALSNYTNKYAERVQDGTWLESDHFTEFMNKETNYLLMCLLEIKTQ